MLTVTAGLQAFQLGRQGSILAPSPSPHSVLMPVARTASYDVRNPHLVQHGLKETTKLVVDHMQVGVFLSVHFRELRSIKCPTGYCCVLWRLQLAEVNVVGRVSHASCASSNLSL